MATLRLFRELFSHRFEGGEGFARLASGLLIEIDDSAPLLSVGVTRDHHPAVGCISHLNVDRSALTHGVARYPLSLVLVGPAGGAFRLRPLLLALIRKRREFALVSDRLDGL